MSVLILSLIIVFGLFLLFVEFLIIPGITIAGIGGGLLMIAAIVGGYHYHGVQVGNYMLLGTIVANFVSFYFLFKRRTWRRMGLETAIDSKVNTIDIPVKSGDKGVAISRLAPMGKARFNDTVYEVQSLDGFVDEGSNIEIVNVKSNKIIVKTL
ncbi:MAG: NfeD family protein [Bacteroidales bacterium]|jgi:membrane-bound ClpP family serine protease|nr:NfeD family protein [Bacteroidales bacterium]